MNLFKRNALIDASAEMAFIQKNFWTALLPETVTNRVHSRMVQAASGGRPYLPQNGNQSMYYMKAGLETLGPRQLLKVFNALTVARLSQ